MFIWRDLQGLWRALIGLKGNISGCHDGESCFYMIAPQRFLSSSSLDKATLKLEAEREILIGQDLNSMLPLSGES